MVNYLTKDNKERNRSRYKIVMYFSSEDSDVKRNCLIS